MSSQGDDIDLARRELAALAGRYAHARSDRWALVSPEIDDAIAADAPLADAARRARRGLVREVTRRLGDLPAPPTLPRYMDALIRVPRERFVLPEDIALSADDLPLALDREGLATVSAPHAYLLTYGLLGLREGDHLLELGTGTGYGAAIALAIVGPNGRVASIEIDPGLAARARRLIGRLEDADPSRITLREGDACALAPALLAQAPRFAPAIKVAITFALHAAPSALVDALPEGGRLVAPVAVGASLPMAFAGDDTQQLMLWERREGVVHRSVHGAVRYVTERH